MRTAAGAGGLSFEVEVRGPIDRETRDTPKADRNRPSEPLTARTPSRVRVRAQQAFLDRLSSTCQVAKACRGARVSRAAVYAWRKADPEFAKAWEAAIEIGVGVVEDEAVRRALQGSDNLLIFLLKAYRPEKYSDKRQLQIGGPGLAEIICSMSEGLQAARERAAKARTCPAITCPPEELEFVERADGPSHGPNLERATS